MIITRIKTLQLKKSPCIIWVVLETDEGITGLGETIPKELEWLRNNLFRAINTH
jgi:L-alanine-DL-glutamate epimerase-like enolase superfamily enzyme